jgi:SET domain-containing protein
MAKTTAVYQADSRIDGIGAFAGQAIKRRAKIGELDGDLVSVREARRRAHRRERIHIVELDDRHALDATLGVSPLKSVNHGCAPNTYVRIAYGRVEFYALRDIAVGEELTARYGETHHEGTLPCKCGMLSCQRYL